MRINEVVAMTDIIVRSRIKEFARISGKPLNVAAEVGPALAKIVEETIRRGCIRAKENGRNTLMAKDL